MPSSNTHRWWRRHWPFRSAGGAADGLGGTSSWRIAISVLACVVVVSGCDPVLKVTVDVAAPDQGSRPNRLVVGISHTDSTIGAVTSAEPRTVELGILEDIPIQNVFLMGWGTANPQPSPGQFDWSTLDERIALITSVGAEPVLTLCCAPDWMKGQPEGTTDWSLLTVAPLPDRYDEFAALAAAAAARYPQVRRFQVWNEMKGFHDPATNAWDAASYTDMYNAVYHAVKEVRPDAQVGGPYAPIDIWSDAQSMSHPSGVRGPWGVVDQRPLDVLTYWLEHNDGADFVSLDGWITTPDRGLITDPFTATEVYAELTRWLAARTDLPIWWSEVHVSDPSWNEALQHAATTWALTRMGEAGASVAMLWSPQAEGTSCAGCLWTDPALGPPTATALGSSITAWSACAPVGGRWSDAASSVPDHVSALAIDDAVYVLNRSALTAEVLVDGDTAVVPPLAMRVAGTVYPCRR